jgi:hypothetical protein
VQNVLRKLDYLKMSLQNGRDGTQIQSCILEMSLTRELLPIVNHKVKVFINLNICRSQGVGRGGFVHRLLSMGGIICLIRNVTSSFVIRCKIPPTLKEYPPSSFVGGIFMPIRCPLKIINQGNFAKCFASPKYVGLRRIYV